MSADPDPTQTAAPPGDVDPNPVPEDVPPEPAADGGRIVVGVDDSEQAAAALRWALAEGILRGTTVEVVHSWSPPVSALPFGATLVVPVDEAAVDAAARTQVDEMVDTVGQVALRPAPQPLRRVLDGADGEDHLPSLSSPQLQP